MPRVLASAPTKRKELTMNYLPMIVAILVSVSVASLMEGKAKPLTVILMGALAGFAAGALTLLLIL